MLTGSTPIYDGDVFLGSIHHDVMVNELIQRTLDDHLEGVRNYIVRADGRLIAHPAYMDAIRSHDGLYDVKSSGDNLLKDQFSSIIGAQGERVVMDGHDNYLAVAKIAGPDWYMVAEYPKSRVRHRAFESVGFLLGAGLFSLVLELIVLFFVLRREISAPLLKLVSRTQEVARGRYQTWVHSFSGRKDELGELEKAFEDMTSALKQRDEMLARHSEDLETLIAKRTRELDEQKALNLQAARLSALGEMAGGIAHEINTPLASIKLLTSQAQQELHEVIPDMENMENVLVRIDRTVDRLAKIIKGLKSFARNGSSDPFEDVDLSQALEDTISLCSERCRLHGIELRVKTPEPGTVIVPGRYVQLCQVLLNLINNSHDAIEGREEKWIEVEVAASENDVRIMVTDSGHGIPEAVRDKIFDPFFTTKPVGKGTGMGLSISHGIIHNHYGELSVDGSCAHTRFVIRFPRKIAQVA